MIGEDDCLESNERTAVGLETLWDNLETVVDDVRKLKTNEIRGIKNECSKIKDTLSTQVDFWQFQHSESLEAVRKADADRLSAITRHEESLREIKSSLEDLKRKTSQETIKLETKILGEITKTKEEVENVEGKLKNQISSLQRAKTNIEEQIEAEKKERISANDRCEGKISDLLKQHDRLSQSSVEDLKRKTSQETTELETKILGEIAKTKEEVRKVEGNLKDQIASLQRVNTNIEEQIQAEQNARVSASNRSEEMITEVLKVHDQLSQVFSRNVEQQVIKSDADNEMETNLLSKIASIKNVCDTLVLQNNLLQDSQTKLNNELSKTESLHNQIAALQSEKSRIEELLMAERNARVTANAGHEEAIRNIESLVRNLEERTTQDESGFEQKFLSIVEGFQFDHGVAIKRLREEMHVKNNEIQNTYDKCKRGFMLFCQILIIFFCMYVFTAIV